MSVNSLYKCGRTNDLGQTPGKKYLHHLHSLKILTLKCWIAKFYVRSLGTLRYELRAVGGCKTSS